MAGFTARARSLVEPAAPRTFDLAFDTGQVEATSFVEQAVAQLDFVATFFVESQHSAAKALEVMRPTRDNTTRMRFMIGMNYIGTLAL